MRVTCRNRNELSGFTIIELMVTLAVLGALLGLAAPSFMSFLVNRRLASQSSDLVSDVLYARSEAAVRSRWIVICPSTDGSSCADADHWSDGRIVFVDVDKDGARTAASEPLLRKTDALSGSPAVAASDFPNSYLTFSPYGALSPSGSAGSLKICASSSEGRLVSIAASGRPATSKVACP